MKRGPPALAEREARRCGDFWLWPGECWGRRGWFFQHQALVSGRDEDDPSHGFGVCLGRVLGQIDAVNHPAKER